MTRRCAGGTSNETKILQSTIMKPMVPLLPIKHSVAIQKVPRCIFSLKKNSFNNYLYDTKTDFCKNYYNIMLFTIYHRNFEKTLLFFF